MGRPWRLGCIVMTRKQWVCTLKSLRWKENAWNGIVLETQTQGTNWVVYFYDLKFWECVITKLLQYAYACSNDYNDAKTIHSTTLDWALKDAHAFHSCYGVRMRLKTLTWRQCGYEFKINKEKRKRNTKFVDILDMHMFFLAIKMIISWHLAT